VITDTLNSFLMTMDANVDEFATRVRTQAIRQLGKQWLTICVSIDGSFLTESL
jgi:hypothetical protein